MMGEEGDRLCGSLARAVPSKRQSSSMEEPARVQSRGDEIQMLGIVGSIAGCY